MSAEIQESEKNAYSDAGNEYEALSGQHKTAYSNPENPFENAISETVISKRNILKITPTATVIVPRTKHLQKPEMSGPKRHQLGLHVIASSKPSIAPDDLTLRRLSILMNNRALAARNSLLPVSNGAQYGPLLFSHQLLPQYSTSAYDALAKNAILTANGNTRAHHFRRGKYEDYDNENNQTQSEKERTLELELRLLKENRLNKEHRLSRGNICCLSLIKACLRYLGDANNKGLSCT